jgi:large subunit ribosomal protein L29
MKLSEMREKTVDELQQFVVDSKKALLDSRIKLSMHKLENTAEISKTKRLIAQAKTVINEKKNEVKTNA